MGTTFPWFGAFPRHQSHLPRAFLSARAIPPIKITLVRSSIRGNDLSPFGAFPGINPPSTRLPQRSGHQNNPCQEQQPWEQSSIPRASTLPYPGSSAAPLTPCHK